MRVRKTDANQPEIVQVFRDAGFSVAHTHTIGSGFPDIIVGCANPCVNILIELKSDKQPPSKRRLTSDEQTFFDNWLGPIAVIESVDQAQQLINNLAGGDGETLH